jgi:hypothetical protein
MIAVSSLWKYGVCQTRDDYKNAFGTEPPAYDPTRPQKYWVDVLCGSDDTQERVGDYMIYRHALQRLGGTWAIDRMILPVAVASSVNIPPPGSLPSDANTNVIPVPLVRGLTGDEELVESPFGVAIRSKSEYIKSLEESVGFTAADRAVLQQILSLLKR